MTSNVRNFASALTAADALRPHWTTPAGPHPSLGSVHTLSEKQSRWLSRRCRRSMPRGTRFANQCRTPASLLTCDLGVAYPLDGALEVKMARALGDNDKVDATAVKGLLSRATPTRPWGRVATSPGESLSTVACRPLLGGRPSLATRRPALLDATNLSVTRRSTALPSQRMPPSHSWFQAGGRLSRP